MKLYLLYTCGIPETENTRPTIATFSDTGILAVGADKQEAKIEIYK